MTAHIGQRASIGFFFMKQSSALPQGPWRVSSEEPESGLVWSPEVDGEQAGGAAIPGGRGARLHVPPACSRVGCGGLS